MTSPEWKKLKKRALFYKGVKHYFLVKFPQDQVLLKFVFFFFFFGCFKGENDDIAFLNIPKKFQRNPLATVGIEQQMLQILKD